MRLVAIHLHGPLGDRYGHLHHLAVRSPREAVHALDANYPGFAVAFLEAERYAIFADGDYRDGEDAATMPVSQELHFSPMIEGNVPLIVPFIAGAFGIGTFAATIISGILVTGLLIGVSFLFRPKMPEAGKGEERDESFIFTGPENITGQGVAIPLIYGRVFAGSVVVSAGQEVADIYTTSAAVGASVPSTPNNYTPAYKDPERWEPGGSHDRAARMVARMAIEPRDIGEPGEAGGIVALPGMETPIGEFNMIWNGSGTEHLRDDKSPDGWPPIIADPVYGWRPENWQPVRTTWVVEEESNSRKQVLVWQPDFDTNDFIYNWNMVRGFYVTDVNMEAEEPEWIAGAEMETPIVDPAL